MTCKLCTKDLELQNSHIIPEFFYKNSYDDKGRAHRFWSNDKAPKNNIYEQKGLREKLLCKPCEGIINDKFERDFSRYWYRDENMPTSIPIGGVASITFDPDLLKGLLLSVLWRASVAQGEYFKSASLGKKHEAQIRDILNDKASLSSYSHYKIMGYVVTYDTGKVVTDLVCTPTRRIINGHSFYFTTMGGIQWIIKVSSHDALEYSTYFMEDSGLLLLPQKHFKKCMIV